MTAGQLTRWCEFWIGRAGSGKTYGCLSAIAAELKKSPRGPLLLFIVPEQASAQMERRLACWPGLGRGFTRARVLSFNHLMHEAFTAVGGLPEGPMLGEAGRIMLLRQLLRRRRGELKTLSASAAQPGTAQSISQTLLELERYGWQPGDLLAWCESLPEGRREGNLLARKLGDLALLWSDYRAELAAHGWLDPCVHHAAGIEAVRRWPALEGAQLWIDGFASFTQMEIDFMRAVLTRAGAVHIALCADPAPLLAPAGEKPVRTGPERLFASAEQTFYTLREALQEGGWQVSLREFPRPSQTAAPARQEPPLNPTRFTASAPLTHVERAVLTRLTPQPCPQDLWEAAAGNPELFDPASPSVLGQPIELIEAADRRAEVEAVARRIAALCRRPQEPPRGVKRPAPLMTWRQVAVLTRNLEGYDELVREVFAQFEIPCFIDRPRQMQGHPLMRLLLSAVSLLRSGWSGAVAVHYLKSGLSPLGDDAATAALLENHILACDPRGRGWMGLLGSAQLKQAWATAAAPLRTLEQALAEGQGPARALWNFLAGSGVRERLEAWAGREEASGQAEAAQIHAQAWALTVEWLEELDRVWPAATGRPLDEVLDELSELIEAALGTVQARLIPPTLNQVTVGAVDRSRTPEVRALFVLGMNEGEFPRQWTPDALLTDHDRAQMAGPRRRLGPDSHQKRLQEYYLAYIALTRAGERLVLSRPLVHANGTAADPSPYFLATARAFPLAPRRLVGRGGLGEAPGLPLRPQEWALELARGLGHLGAGPAAAARLAAWMQQGDPLEHSGLSDAQRTELEQSRRALIPPAPAQLPPALAGRFWAGRAALAVTPLERFGACPFQFFCADMLRLQPRLESRLNAMDLGSIRHGALEDLFRHYAREQGGEVNWGRVDPQEATDLVAQMVERQAADPALAARLAGNGLDRLGLEALAEQLGRLVHVLTLAGRRSALRQVHAEWRLDRDGGLCIEAGGTQFTIRGVIDRVDALGEAGQPGRPLFFFDYKTGQRRLSITRLHGGLDLQPLTYALAYAQAAARGRGPTPQVGGVYYWPMSAPPVQAAGQPADDSLLWLGQLAPSGIFEEDLADLLDGQARGEGKSPLFRFTWTSKGALHGAGTSHWPAGSLARWLRFERELLGDYLSRITRGEIGLWPAREGRGKLACGRCDFRAVCRLAVEGQPPAREIPKASRKSILAQWEAQANPS